jgi:hypothetical protein
MVIAGDGGGVTDAGGVGGGGLGAVVAGRAADAVAGGAETARGVAHPVAAASATAGATTTIRRTRVIPSHASTQARSLDSIGRG